MIKFKEEIYKRTKDNLKILIDYYFDTDKMKIRFSVISSDLYQPVIYFPYTKKRVSDYKLWLETIGFVKVDSCTYYKDFIYDCNTKERIC